MPAIEPGTRAPEIPGVAFDRPTAVYVYKVTCPVCQISAPVTQTFEAAYPGHVVGVGQDPPEKLERFSSEFGVTFPSVEDAPPYDVSNAYGIRTVPTLFLIEDGTVTDTVESWDREGFNRVSRRLAAALGAEYAEISHPSDGLPAFRPG
ncbi:MAG: redoxin domain-containing protein [Actinomycetota bacterium]